MKNRTVIIDRVTAFPPFVTSDQIIVLKDGVVAEQGSHDQLIARNGLYGVELHRTQFTDASLRDAQSGSPTSAAASAMPTATAATD